MVLSIGAATRNVRGGRFRSTITGFLAQLARKASALPATAIRARERKYLRKGIQISPRSWGRRQVILCTGDWGPGQVSKPPQWLSTNFVAAGTGGFEGGARPGRLIHSTHETMRRAAGTPGGPSSLEPDLRAAGST